MNEKTCENCKWRILNKPRIKDDILKPEYKCDHLTIAFSLDGFGSKFYPYKWFSCNQWEKKDE